MRSRKNDDVTWDVTGRIKSLEMFSGALVATPESEAEPEAIPVHRAPLARVPQPRRSKVFLRTAGGRHGAFAELTLTAPQPRHALD
jgi:hypothetical protein